MWVKPFFTKGNRPVLAFADVHHLGIRFSMPTYPDSPQVAVGAVVFKQNRILLVKRGKPPGRDQWAIPGGSIQLGETLQQAAEREILEETGIIIQAGDPIFMFDLIQKDRSGVIRFHYIIIDLIAHHRGGHLIAGDDALAAGWFLATELEHMPVNHKTLELIEKLFGRETGFPESGADAAVDPLNDCGRLDRNQSISSWDAHDEKQSHGRSGL